MSRPLQSAAGLLVMYALISAILPAAEAGFFSKTAQEPAFAVVPPIVASKGRGSLTELQHLAKGETFVSKLLGTDCFTQSLSVVDKDCSKLGSEKKSRLAIALAICHLDQLGLPTFPCKSSMTLKQCAEGMHDDRQYTTYMEFLSNIDTMCLFLQSQDFQSHTQFMINSLYSSSKHAAEQLDAVDTHLTQSLSTLDGMSGKLTQVATAQKQQLQLSHENLKGVQQLHTDSQQLHAQLAHALQNEDLMLLKQSQVLANLASLDEEESGRAESASQRWQEAQEQAAHLLQQQHQYQQVQEQLIGDLRQLSDNSAGLRTALDVVVQYEQRGAAMLTHMLGSTYSVQDLMAYALAALGITATGLSNSLRAARLPLIGLFALSVVGERAAMHSFHHLLEIDPTGEIMMAMPVFGTTVNPKTAIRRACLATAVVMLMWGMYIHTDNEQETLRLCKRIERQQQCQEQRQQKQQDDLLEAQKQLYIGFMTKMRQQYPGPSPTYPDQTHTHFANGQSPLLLPRTDGDAHENHEQTTEQLLQPLSEQVQQQTPQWRRSQSSRSLKLSGELPPSAFSNGACNRKHQPSPRVPPEPNSASCKSDQDNRAILRTHEEQTNTDDCLEQHGHHGVGDVNQSPARNSARPEQYSTTAQQKTRIKKRSASQTDEGAVLCQEAADSMQTLSEATSNVGCKASKRQRPDNKAKGKLKV